MLNRGAYMILYVPNRVDPIYIHIHNDPTKCIYCVTIRRY